MSFSVALIKLRFKLVLSYLDVDVVLASLYILVKFFKMIASLYILVKLFKMISFTK